MPICGEGAVGIGTFQNTGQVAASLSFYKGARSLAFKKAQILRLSLYLSASKWFIFFQNNMRGNNVLPPAAPWQLFCKFVFWTSRHCLWGLSFKLSNLGILFMEAFLSLSDCFHTFPMHIIMPWFYSVLDSFLRALAHICMHINL